MKLSIVSTLYCSEPHVEEFYRRCTAVAKTLVGDDYEILFVNDGSPDRSLELALGIYEADSHVVIVDLSRNFGHHKAMMAGLAESKGDTVFLLDSDLEEEPEWLIDYSNQLDSNAVDVVYGVQESRNDSGFSKFFGSLFYVLFRFFTDVDQPNNIVTARLMSRRYVDALLLHREYEIIIGGLWLITGFSQLAVPVKKLSGSETTYSFSHKLSHLVNSITSFSSKPLVYTFYAGCAISAISLLYVVWLLICYFFLSRPIDGFTTIAVSIWLLGGFIISLMGIQGIYIAKIFSEVKQRPLTIIRQLYRRKSEDEID